MYGHRAACGPEGQCGTGHSGVGQPSVLPRLCPKTDPSPPTMREPGRRERTLYIQDHDADKWGAGA